MLMTASERDLFEIDKIAKPHLTVLGIETSCDETAASIVTRTYDGKGIILSNVVKSQFRDLSLIHI